MELNNPAIEHKIKSLNLGTQASGSSDTFGNSEYCYSFLNSAPKDQEVQKRLQQERLKYVLNQLERERVDTSMSRSCLFCSKHFTGNRSIFLDHFMEQHNFTIGAPDNIVFISEYLDHLEKLLKNLQCLFCEKIFKDMVTLKEHMRKKQHKRINPQNKVYDRFYVINYLELGKTWVDIEKEDDRKEYNYQDGDEKEIMDWETDSSYICLFCDNKLGDFEETLAHMKDEHGFDFRYLKQTFKLDFYKQMKLVNYIRKKMYLKECMICDSKFIVQDDLLEHMIETGHIASLPEPSNWDQPLYFFPTFENDNLLCGLDDDDTECQDYVVVPEDTSLPVINESIG